MLTITDLNAEFAKLSLLRGRTPQTTAAEREEKRALARLMPYRDGTVFIAKFVGSGAWERHPKGDEIVQIIDGTTTLHVIRDSLSEAFTLGAGDFDVAYRVVLKQIAPRVLNSIRLNLKAVMLFLFAGEMIASTDGLAYRIALLRRHMGMDVIIPYVLWVALLLFLVDLGMRILNRRLHPWFTEA